MLQDATARWGLGSAAPEAQQPRRLDGRPGGGAMQQAVYARMSGGTGASGVDLCLGMNQRPAVSPCASPPPWHAAPYCWCPRSLLSDYFPGLFLCLRSRAEQVGDQRRRGRRHAAAHAAAGAGEQLGRLGLGMLPVPLPARCSATSSLKACWPPFMRLSSLLGLCCCSWRWACGRCPTRPRRRACKWRRSTLPSEWRDGSTKQL